MKEEQNQSVRFSEIMSNLSDDSFETSSIQLLLTSKNEIKKSNRHMILLGVGLFVIFIIVVLTVVIVSSHIIDSKQNDDFTSGTSTSSMLPHLSLPTNINGNETANSDYNISSSTSTSSTLQPLSLRTISVWKRNISTTTSTAFESIIKTKDSTTIPSITSTTTPQGTSTTTTTSSTTTTTPKSTSLIPTTAPPKTTLTTSSSTSAAQSPPASEYRDAPREKGFCVLANGADQNSGVKKLNSVDGNTITAQEECMKLCKSVDDATGCEVIWDQGNRGCYAHTQDISHGNDVDRHFCWVFSKAPKDVPREKGFCVLANGADQNSGVKKLNSVDGNTIKAQEECMKLCKTVDDATGCEVIWDQVNRGCYAHTQDISHGNNVDRHFCWVFSKAAKNGKGGKAKLVRLADGKNTFEGRVEVFVQGEWGTICNDYFDQADANVVCKMKGFRKARRYFDASKRFRKARRYFDASKRFRKARRYFDASKRFRKARRYFDARRNYKIGSGKIWLDNLKCKGHESSIFECEHAGIGVENCGHHEDIAVICEPSSTAAQSARIITSSSIKSTINQVPEQSVSAVQGSSVELPCNLTAPIRGDKVRLVLWFKNESSLPIYTYDTRGKSHEEARHWSDDKVLGGRAFFRGDHDPGRLVLDNVKAKDEATYKCRVDFRQAPTRISNIDLNVIGYCGSDFAYHNGTMIDNNASASNASGCLEQCNTEDQCKFWDYGSGHPSWRKICRLRSNPGSGPIRDDGYSYGSKDCIFQGSD